MVKPRRSKIIMRTMKISIFYSTCPLLMNHHFPSSIKNRFVMPNRMIKATPNMETETSESKLAKDSNKNTIISKDMLIASDNQKNGLPKKEIFHSGRRKLRKEYPKKMESMASPKNINVRI